MGKRSFWLRFLAALASGLLVAVLFPPFRMSLLAWVAMVPVIAALWSVTGKRAGWKGFALGWTGGMMSCSIQFHWVAEVSWLGALLLPAYLACYWGLFGAFAATVGNPWRNRDIPIANENPGYARSLRVAFCLGAVWAGLEWLRGWMFTGFGWNGMGVAFRETLVMAQSADLLGVAGLSLILVFFQAVMVQAAVRYIGQSGADKRRLPVDLVLAVSLVALLAGYGIARIGLERRAECVRLKTLLVQINIPQDASQQLWSALDVHMAYEADTLKALAGLGKTVDGRTPPGWPDWVMWPETALTGRILRAEDGTWGSWRENQETIARVREAGPFQLIYGVTEQEADACGDGLLAIKPGGHIWNSIAVMSPADALQTYRKHHLVIFGETIPYADSLPWLAQIYQQQSGVEYGGSFTPGVSFDPLQIPTADGTMIGAIPTVCFEDSVGRLTRKFARPGPQVIVNVTNDGWFRESAAADQHFAYARFRAIELRRPLLRCANTGVSAAVDTTGSTAHPDTGKPQILVGSDGNHFVRGSLLTETKVPLHPSFSLYALIGDWGIIVLSLAGFLWARMRSGTPSVVEDAARQGIDF